MTDRRADPAFARLLGLALFVVAPALAAMACSNQLDDYVLTCANDVACTSGLCIDGTCRPACASASDCAPEFVCVAGVTIEAKEALHCSPAKDYPCTADSACTMLILAPCQSAVCREGVCSAAVIADSEGCDDRNPCTSGETCRRRLPG